MAKPELLGHVKFGRLQRTLGLRRYEAIGILETLWHHCWSCCDADVGTADDVAWIVDWPAEDAARLAEGLRAAGFLDAAGDQFIVHDLWQHAPSYAKLRHERLGGAANDPPKNAAPDAPRKKVNLNSGTPFRSAPLPKTKSSADALSPRFEFPHGAHTAAINERVLARLAHEIDPDDRGSWTDAADALKWQAARYGVPYDGASARRAISRVAYGRGSPFAHLRMG